MLSSRRPIITSVITIANNYKEGLGKRWGEMAVPFDTKEKGLPCNPPTLMPPPPLVLLCLSSIHMLTQLLQSHWTQ